VPDLAGVQGGDPGAPPSWRQGRWGALVWKVVRYGLAAVGPVGTAASQFALSVQLLHLLPPVDFGVFSFLLVASQLSAGVWSALFCAPMPLLLARGSDADKAAMTRCLMTANLVFSAISLLVFAGLALMLHLPPPVSLLFGGYGMVMLLRWFARAHAYATGGPVRTAVSDILYSLTLLAAVLAMSLWRPNSLLAPYGGLLLSAVVAMAPFGLTYLKQQFIEISPRALLAYAQVWRRHSGWSLVGVVTTEATANAHAYIVTLFAGATAFAPLAASALLMRPIGVTTNALTELERPQMARQLANNRPDEALKAARFFRIMLIAAWAATVVGALVLTRYAPGALFPKQYDRHYLAIGTALWLAIAGVRLLRAPESVFLQAAGQFRPLAHASMISCGISIIGVTAMLILGGPLYSLVGVLLGEMVFAAWIWRQARRWRQGSTDPIEDMEKGFAP